MPELQPHQQRVVAERDELYTRWSKLSDFIGVNEPGFIFANLDVAEQTRLKCQLSFMGGYLDMLDARIAAF